MDAMSYYNNIDTGGSSEEERMSPKRPTRRRRKKSLRSESKSGYSRDSDSPRSEHNSDTESTSHMIYNRSSSESEDDDGNIPYAGAKFNSPPPAHMLPIPPSSWITMPQMGQVVTLSAMSSHLRQMLKVPAV
jgi:hypothetical protein